MTYKPKFLTPAEGGLGAATVATSGKFLIGNGTNWITSTASFPTGSGAVGTILRSDGTNWVASTPTYPNAASTSGKVLISDGTNFVVSTPTFPNASATSGKMIVSDGTNWIASTPTFPNASATSGKFIRSDGTNWIASTPTLPTTGGTASTLLRSDGTNWVNTSAFKVASTDIMTNTAQPMISAFVHTSQTNATGDGTSFDVIFDSVADQNGSNYNTGTGKYTCPVTGFYLLSYTVTFTGVTAAMNDGNSQVLSSAGTIQKRSWNAAAIRAASNEAVISDCVITKRTAGDTLYVNIQISNGTKVASTKADSFGPFCYLSIQLLA